MARYCSKRPVLVLDIFHSQRVLEIKLRKVFRMLIHATSAVEEERRHY